MEYFVLYIKEGERVSFEGKDKLKVFAKKYKFDADKVLQNGRCNIVDEWEDIIGGVKKISYATFVGNTIKPLSADLKLFGDS
tara:strand:+ start:2593 stop:2838 length:246 start_codon:yes stop_codon:yes gene_type:complete